MKPAFKKHGLPLLAAILATQQSVAFASINIGYAPNNTPASIPTLSEWGMIGLSVLLAAAAVYTLRNKGGGKPLASVILACALALGGFSGNKLMSEANAIVALTDDCGYDNSTCHMTQAGGGTVITNSTTNPITVINSTAVAQTVTAVTATAGEILVSPSPSSPACAVGLVVPPTLSCYVAFAVSPPP